MFIVDTIREHLFLLLEVWCQIYYLKKEFICKESYEENFKNYKGEGTCFKDTRLQAKLGKNLLHYIIHGITRMGRGRKSLRGGLGKTRSHPIYTYVHACMCVKER